MADQPHHRPWRAYAALALTLLLTVAATDAVAQETDLETQAQAAAALREVVIARAVTVLEEGPTVHSQEELAAAIVALRDLRAADAHAVQQLVRYLNYEFPDDHGPDEWINLDTLSARPSAWRTLLEIGPRVAPFVIAQIGADYEGDDGLIYALALESLLRPLTDIYVRAAAAGASDPVVAARIEAFRVKYRSVFREDGSYSLPRPVRPVRGPDHQR